MKTWLIKSKTAHHWVSLSISIWRDLVLGPLNIPMSFVKILQRLDMGHGPVLLRDGVGVGY